MEFKGLKRRLKFEEGKSRHQIFPRACVAGSVFLHDENELLIANIRDVSAGGVFIESLVAPSKGSQVKLVLKSAKLAQPIQAEGTVVRVDKCGGIAVEFTTITDDARKVIHNCVFEARMEMALRGT